MNLTLKRVLIATVVSAALAGSALAQPFGGMGPGMMDGYGGYGGGPGAMGGFGGYGMGPGMMCGNRDAGFAGLNLSQEQRKKIAEIREENAKAMWQLMGTMHQQDFRMRGMHGVGPFDDAAARKSFQAMAEAQKAMFEMQLEHRKKIEAVLTQEQREKLRQNWVDR